MAPTDEEVADLFAMANNPAISAERIARADGFDPSRSWVDGSPKRLSDRLWSARQWDRDQMDAILKHAIATGEDGLETARKLEQFLDPAFAPTRRDGRRIVRGQNKAIVTEAPGRGGSGSFPARRLARTEITRAHGAGTIAAAEKSPFAKGVKWSLSGRHPKADVCDTNASRDVGLGPGVYPTNDVPRYPEHPQDLCTLSVSVNEDTDAVVDALRQQFGLGEAEPVVVVPPSAPTAPVSDALRLPPPPSSMQQTAMRIRGDLDVRAVAQDGLRAIDAVHTDGVLPSIPVEADFLQFSTQAARFSFATTGDPIAIGVNQMKQWALTARESFVHEVGHFLDFSGLGTAGKFASYDDPLLDGWRAAVKDSRAVRQLTDELDHGVRKIPMPDGSVRDYQVDKKYLTYLLDNSEVWARSYAQYITTKSRDGDLLRALEETKESSMYPSTWTDEDFAPIAAAMDTLFRTLGWLR